jgi:hypothetical protein
VHNRDGRGLYSGILSITPPHTPYAWGTHTDFRLQLSLTTLASPCCRCLRAVLCPTVPRALSCIDQAKDVPRLGLAAMACLLITAAADDGGPKAEQPSAVPLQSAMFSIAGPLPSPNCFRQKCASELRSSACLLLIVLLLLGTCSAAMDRSGGRPGPSAPT